MDKNFTNPCIRCGKERIIKKSWKETTTTFSGGQQEVTYTQFICPDPECQEALDKELLQQKNKREKILQEREKRLKGNQGKVPAIKSVLS